MHEDPDRCYRAVQSRDARFDGWFVTAVTSTHIYCRPSCPALTPKRQNVRFYPTAAAAQDAGFRACLRCRPDAAPGSPEWLGRADVAARAVKLILLGTVDREGVQGVASRLGYSQRQLHRLLVAEVGTGALALARAQRAQTARILLQTTDLPITQVAFGAGFASVRQFNDTVQTVFARTPTELRRRTAAWTGPSDPQLPGSAVPLRLAFRRPFASDALFSFLGQRAIPGVEAFDGVTYRRSLRLAHGGGRVELKVDGPGSGDVQGLFVLDDLRDLTNAIARVRHLLNLDADPVAVDAALGADRLLGPLVRARPGLRVPGAADGFELAARAVVGQQISVVGARTIAGALVREAGEPLAHGDGSLTHLFPSAEAVVEAVSRQAPCFAMPGARRRALGALADAVASERLVIDAAADPHELSSTLAGLPGIGAWTAGYIAMRGVGDPDAFLPTDLGVRRALAALGHLDTPRAVSTVAEQWRPWRAYAVAHLWTGATEGSSEQPHQTEHPKKGASAA